ncbi:MAG: tail fiber protein [Microvirga sp.]|nr:tail fiber protein [Microvirga sp.]
MDSPYIAMIMMWAPSWAPSGWALCEGQELPVQQYQALYSLIGNIYGGSGSQTFKLPDLRSRLPVGVGSGPGLSTRALGQMSGQEGATLTVANLPAHTHAGDALALHATTATATSQAPTAQSRLAAAVIPQGLQQSPALIYGPTGSGDQPLAPGSISGVTGSTGSGAALSTMPPFLAINFCIALEGLYPQRP